jgi:TorA maturation chaperone TorD
VATVSESTQLSSEERARADCYALISRLFYAPADDELLQRLAAVPVALDDQDAGLQLEKLDEDDPGISVYAVAFRELLGAARGVNADAVRQEYDDLFVGAGKALITPYTSGYTESGAPDRHLVTLRELIASWGLARRESAFEVEDHVSALCDVMRWLIERNRPLEEQIPFFSEFVYAGVGTFCDAIDANPNASFYRLVARLARAFLTVEKSAFDMHAAE